MRIKIYTRLASDLNLESEHGRIGGLTTSLSIFFLIYLFIRLNASAYILMIYK